MAQRETEGVDPTEPKRRRRLVSWLALGAVVATILALLVLDLLLVRPPEQRAFIMRNIECLRCHADLIPQLKQASIHQPFLKNHCSSCHTSHGYEQTPVFRPSDLGPRWLQVWLEQLSLRALWELLSSLHLAKPQSSPGTPSLAKGGSSLLTASQQELCWTCHGRLAPERLREFQHKPFANGRCTSCHDPHASDNRPLLRAKVSDMCAACHQIGPELVAAEVHEPFGRLRCLTCHEPHASADRGLLVSAQKPLCFGCHRQTAALTREAVQHQPFDAGQCTGCHRPHSARFASLLATPQPELCYGCHATVRADFVRASRHPVPSRLLCDDCHRPHATPHRGLLPALQRELCLGCHGNVRGELARAVAHEAAAVGDCTKCHEAHGSFDAPLLHAADPALCRRCHTIPAEPVRSPPPFRSLERPPKVPTSEVPGVPGGRRPSGNPDPILQPGHANAAAGETSHRVSRCADCHEAHGSAYARLTVAAGDALCMRCHARDVSHFGRSAHRGFACSRCHRPHLAPGAPLLTAASPQLCLRCHPGYTHPGDFHPVGPRYYDYLARGPLTCTSTCHDPHGSSYTRMLRVPYNTGGYGTDYICLLCHTKVGLIY